MNVSDYKDGKIIILSKAFDTRGKVLNIIYFAFFTLVGIGFVSLANSADMGGTGLAIITVAAVGVYLFAGYRFINKALETEKLVINKNHLTISRSGFLLNHTNSFDTSLISNFRHLEKPETTKHPLAGETFDYLGFQTEQQVINEMHGDNRIAFDYNGRTIKFGENMYSWDFEQLEILLRDVTGSDFRGDDKLPEYI